MTNFFTKILDKLNDGWKFCQEPILSGLSWVFFGVTLTNAWNAIATYFIQVPIVSYETGFLFLLFYDEIMTPTCQKPCQKKGFVSLPIVHRVLKGWFWTFACYVNYVIIYLQK